MQEEKDGYYKAERELLGSTDEDTVPYGHGMFGDVSPFDDEEDVTMMPTEQPNQRNLDLDVEMT